MKIGERSDESDQGRESVCLCVTERTTRKKCVCVDERERANLFVREIGTEAQ